MPSPKPRPLLAAAAIAAAALLGACGPSWLPVIGAKSASDVALRAADLPGALKQCSESGQVDAYLDNLKKDQPDAYKPSVDQWNSLKQGGATDAWIGAFARSDSVCAGIFAGSSAVSAGKPEFAENIVVKYKDAASAAKAYRNGIFGLQPSATTPRTGLSQGSGTGLGGNSMVFSGVQGDRSLYLALWQREDFAVLFVAQQMRAADARRAVGDINSRIS